MKRASLLLMDLVLMEEDGVLRRGCLCWILGENADAEGHEIAMNNAIIEILVMVVSCLVLI